MPRRAEQKDRLRAVKEDESAIHHYPGQFLVCRDLLHAWELVGYWHEGGFVHRRLVCARCTTTRHDWWSANGYWGGRSYDYPELYKWTGDERLRKQDVRAEALSRAQVYETADEMTAAVLAAAH
jgi:hypothetical protein